MPTDTHPVDRFSLERSFIADLRPVFSREFTRARQSPLAIPYGQFQQELAGVMAANLLTAFRSAGAALVIGHDLVVSQGAFDSIGRQWSMGYANELAARTVATSREMASQAVGQVMWNARPADRQVKIDLALAGIFMADSRLENIAITETTTGISQGENAVVIAFPQGGRNGNGSGGRGGSGSSGNGNPTDRLIAIWRTEEDARVCPVCAPFDWRTDEVWGRRFPNGPPAHPRCRCWRLWMRASEWARGDYRRAA